MLLLAMLWGNAARAQEDEKCAASPRWLAVTVVKAHIATSTQEIEMPAGVQLLDRCYYGDQVEVRDISATSKDPKDVAASSEGAKSIVWQASSTGDNIVVRTFFVKETVQQICAAMDDCGDATRVLAERGHREQ